MRHAQSGRFDLPGHHAGTERVSCVDTEPGRCSVEIEYDMTLLEGAPAAALEGYAPATFGNVMEERSGAINGNLKGAH